MATAGASFASTKETTNYARLCRLLVDVGSQALRDKFDRIHPPTGLHAVLTSSSVKNNLKSLYRGKRKILNPTQWGQLYPPHPPPTSTNFDITLLTVLLRNICHLKTPASGWDKLPAATDTNTQDDIARVKYYRNTLYGHAATASIDDASFNRYWSEICEALVRLGGATYQTKIDSLKTDCMDPDCEKHYRDLLEQWKKDDDSIKDKLEEMKDDLDDISGNVMQTRNKMEEIKEKLDSDLKTTGKEIKDDISEKLEQIKMDLMEKMDANLRVAPVTDLDKKKPKSELPEEDCNTHGHTEDVNAVVQALSDVSSSAVAGVLISGIAGVGKSTVAIQAGHQLKNKFENIVKFCSLRGAHSKTEEVGKSVNEVEGEIREIMNVCVPGHQQTSDNPRHVLLNWCRGLEYDIVLILDNAEDAMEDQTRRSFINLLKDLRKCSDRKIKFLVTSQRSDLDKFASGINIKHMQLGPLDTKESIKVLKDGANFSSDSCPEEEGKLNKIAELCENIPLALRLAGPLLSSDSEYTPEALIQDLEKNPTETLGLERMMEIAFDKLDEPLKVALVCLSVFVRSFDRNAAEALLGSPNCTQHLMRLKQRCLIQKQDNRYLMHLLIRSFAKNIGERKEYRHILAHGQQSYVEYFLSLMMKNSTKYWGKDTCKESFDLFNEERLNLECTLREVGKKKVRPCRQLEDVVNTCQQVAPYIEYCVPFELYYDFLDGILHFAEEQAKITNQVEILLLLYHESRKHGSNKKQQSQDLICQAIKLHDENRQLFQQERLSEVFYLGHYGRYISQDRKQRKEAKPLLEKAITICNDEMYGANFDKARILVQLGHNAKLHEDGIKRDEALSYYKEALCFRQGHYGQHVLTAFAYKDLADCYLYIEDLENAKEQYDGAIHVLEGMGILEQKEAIPIFKNFGICYQKSGKFEESRRMFEEGSKIADTAYGEGNHKWKVWIKTCLAVLLYKNYPDEVATAEEISKEVLKMGADLALGEWPLKEELEKLYKKGLKA